jgi:phosphoglycolate phosphatase-like HAD superfamily hydrolase
MLGVGIWHRHPIILTTTRMREEFFVNYEHRMTELTYVFEGVAEMVAQLHQRGLPWGVVTNKSMRFAGPLTRTMPLFATAGTVVGGDTTPHAKPHPAPLLEAARQLGVAPHRGAALVSTWVRTRSRACRAE